MQAGRRYFQIEIVTEPFLELFDEEYASLGIEFADPFHMAEEKSKNGWAIISIWK